MCESLFARQFRCLSLISSLCVALYFLLVIDILILSILFLARCLAANSFLLASRYRCLRASAAGVLCALAVQFLHSLRLPSLFLEQLWNKLTSLSHSHREHFLFVPTIGR